ncbi:hypothetical protein TEA_012858 [Camellia sinensis var. sinensis]|uniref:Uncharacterized protein n=1 Tax=Camellia sinensis var. sinensis TaxID=542762 RepID=A0A4S4DPQ1_CAMSN|nr:hypothetical protein TEA_012858 [Camellia sinensis var. sinensis]
MVGFKNRYMVMEVFLDPNRDLVVDDPIIITQFNVSKAIKDSLLENFGECGLASSLGSLQVKYVNPITKLSIIRASREEYQKVWSAITMVRSIGNCPVLFNLLDLSDNYSRFVWYCTVIGTESDSYVSILWIPGSIKACKNAALKCEELKFEQYKLVAGASLTAEVNQHMQNCLEKIRTLEH